MLDPRDSITEGISIQELERRWALVREQMSENKGELSADAQRSEFSAWS